MLCFFCKKENTVSEKLGFRDVCDHCGRDAHICLNCGFYDRAAYNECREPQADRVVDKEKFNFCEYFVGAQQAAPHVGAGLSRPLDPVSEAKKKLEALFKKT